MTPFQLLKILKHFFLQDKQQQQQESKAKKMPVSSQRSCDSDPMEVVEKMRQMRQNRLLQRHKSGENGETLAPPPPFMRSHSNPDGSTRTRSRPSSIVNNNEDNLDEMLGRVRNLRETRKQILKDMAMMKDAFNDTESQESHQSKPLKRFILNI